MTTMERKRKTFLRAVTADVWTRLEDAGVAFNFGEISDRFLEMLDDKDIRKEVADIFYDRIVS